jgi:chromosome partitioning protein
VIIALVGQKGGTGKSTLAISLACELQARGRGVLLVDADTKNRTSLRSAAIADREGREHPPVCGMDAQELSKKSGVPTLARAYQDIIIDAPGRSGPDLTAPLMVADVALFPAAPTTADAGVFEEQLEESAAARRSNRHLVLGIVLCKLLPRTAIADPKEAAEVFRPTGLRVFRARTFTRIAWQRCLDVGVGVAQHAPGSPAADELRAVLAEALHLNRRKR